MSTLFTGAALAWADTASANREIVAGAAAHPLNETWNVAADAHVSLGNVRGKLDVSGWDKNEVALSGSLGAGSTLEVSGDARNLVLRVKATHSGWFGGNGPDHDSALVVHVPRSAALELHVVSADAAVAEMSGKSLTAGSVSGTLTLASTAPQIDVDSVSGDVSLTMPKSDPQARAHVQTVSGDIQAKNLAGHVKLETVSGTIGCACGVVRELETGSVSGDANIDAKPAAQARLHLESMSGDIRLRLPANLSARIDAATFSGGIGTDFGTAHDKERGPGSSLQANIGGGDAQIRVQSFSGDIELRRQ
jgi:DUF4097 and DUF4098 domain-containing protein YvlB